MPAILVGGALLVLIGGFGFTRAEQGRRIPPAQPNVREADAPRRRRGDRSADRGRLHRVSRPLRREGPRRGPSRPARTAWRRSIIQPAPTDRIVRDHRPQGRIRAASAIVWDDERHPVDMPPSKELRFEPGTTIGGIVQDEAGHPIAGAESTSSGLRPSARPCTASSRSAPSETDAQGRWRLDVAPKDLSNVSVHPQHPRYMQRPGGSAHRRTSTA